MDGEISRFLAGDVMLGRGIDQILPHSANPTLAEPAVRDARDYIGLAERAHGPLPRPVDPTWAWGDALTMLATAAPDVRIINLETSVTTSDDFAPAKQVYYRMHPANLPALSAVAPDACLLSNNHVADFGRRGLVETLDVLAGAGVAAVGAGRNADEAASPAVVPLGNGRRVLVFAVGTVSSGIPRDWAATAHRAGVALTELTDDAAAVLMAAVRRVRLVGRRRPVDPLRMELGDDVPNRHRRFAHRLIDDGVDVVHGHSSHHPRAIEVYRGRLILYGCDDLVDDYEGIAGCERYRPDLRLLQLARIESGSGRLIELRMAPMQAARLRLHRAGPADTAWLADMLTRATGEMAPPVVVTDGRMLLMHPPSGPAW